MGAIEEYFRDSYPADKQTVEKIDKLLGEAKSIFELYELEDSKGKPLNCWPYEIVNDKDVGRHSGKTSAETFSFNINAMALFALAVASGRIIKSPLITDVQYGVLFSPDDKAIRFFDSNLKELLKKVDELKGKSKDRKLVSTSVVLGQNDPFTLTWLYELLKQPGNDKDIYKGLRADIINILYTRLNECFVGHELEKVLDLGDEDHLLDHIFPLVSLLHFYMASKKEAKKLQEDNKAKKGTEVPHAYMSNIREYLLSKVYRQFTFQKLGNTSFDAAAMVFAMEGVLLLDGELGRTSDQGLVYNFFDAIKQCQEHAPYWQPVKPFIITDLGMTIMPYSISIAGSLLRICKSLEKDDSYFFSKHIQVFRKYCDWLFTRTTTVKVLTGNNKVAEFTGWQSEFVNDPRKINPWETVQVILYLVQYRTMYQEHIAREALLTSNLKAQLLTRNGDETPAEYWKGAREINEPLLAGKDDVFKEYRLLRLIRENYIEPLANNDAISRRYSMLIYGPPGTGKTSITEDLAKALQWPLITITPSDFISEGSSQVEARAKSIFSTLEEQSDAVILFDEIDRMVLDRNSDRYQEQSDIFQFMTPSMLVKLKNLRNAGKCVFIIATNYEERIDNAIKRIGRIDQSFLVLPPNKAQREALLLRFLNKFFHKYGLDIKGDDVKIQEEILNKTTFAVKGELQLLAEEVVKELKKGGNSKKLHDSDVLNKKMVTIWDEKMPGTQIKLATYTNRFFKDDDCRKCSGQVPYTEFLLLVYLKYEGMGSGKKLDLSLITPLEKKLICDVIALLASEDDPGDSVTESGIEKIKTKLKHYIHDDTIYDGLLRLYEHLVDQPVPKAEQAKVAKVKK